MLRRFASLIFAIALWPAMALAEKPPELRGAPEAAEKVGDTSFGFLFWNVFDASLWSPDGAFNWDKSFALALTYRRTFTAESLTEKTIEEMARISGNPEASYADFARSFLACIDDVGPGDRITAVSIGPTATRLFLNGQSRCDLERVDLRRDFFSIWLSDDSLFPDATARLKGDGAQ